MRSTGDSNQPHASHSSTMEPHETSSFNAFAIEPWKNDARSF
jgi:hypothetical protein